MGDRALERQACDMHRTRRQATLVDHVRIAMSRREERRTAASGQSSATRSRRHVESAQMARWENDGGAIGQTADQRPRPLP
jgi:hypothetical protein